METKIQSAKADPTKAIKVMRQSGGGRSTPHKELEILLLEWVNESNLIGNSQINLGLVVKDKTIRAKALAIAMNMGKKVIKIHLFRNNLVSRRPTSTRTIPENGKELALDFIIRIQTLIKEKKIKDSNILNFDQIPRYYEERATSTITTRGNFKLILGIKEVTIKNCG